MSSLNRCDFLRVSLLGGAAFSVLNPNNIIGSSKDPDTPSSYVSITSGGDRAEMTFRALQPFAKQIRRSIGNLRVVLKPNNVLIYVPHWLRAYILIWL